MPYKLIAAHLHKTELACRLHYHQLGIPNNGRQRTSSVSSSVASHSPVLASLESTPGMKRGCSQTIPSPDGPESTRSIIPKEISTTASPQQHIPILSKLTSSQSQSQRSNLLRLDTTNLFNHQEHTMPKIDQVRLRKIYGIGHSNVWFLIAADYGSGIAPTTLEQA